VRLGNSCAVLYSAKYSCTLCSARGAKIPISHPHIDPPLVCPSNIAQNPAPRHVSALVGHRGKLQNDQDKSCLPLEKLSQSFIPGTCLTYSNGTIDGNLQQRRTRKRDKPHQDARDDPASSPSPPPSSQSHYCVRRCSAPPAAPLGSPFSSHPRSGDTAPVAVRLSRTSPRVVITPRREQQATPPRGHKENKASFSGQTVFCFCSDGGGIRGGGETPLAGCLLTTRAGLFEKM
jgi:hypothetical protein